MGYAGMIELARRLVLCLGVAAGIWLYFLADQKPFYSVAAASPSPTRNPIISQDGASTDQPARPLIAPGERPAPAAPLEVAVSGQGWTAFFDKAQAVSLGKDQDPDWIARVPQFQRNYRAHVRDIYFRQDEPPLSELAAGLPRPLPKARLALSGPDNADPKHLSLRERIIRDEDFHLGSGLSEYGSPPRSMAFPRRGAAWLAWGAGLAAYLLVPRPRRSGEIIRYAAWLALLGDLGGLLLFAFFFALPILIVGGSMQAVRAFGGFPMFCWPLAGLGLLALWYSANTAAFWAQIEPDRIVIGGLGGNREYPFADIESVGEAVLRPPRWLIWLLWLAALTGKGAGRMMGAGQALILGGSQEGGLVLRLRDGTRAYIWLTNAMGALALQGVDTLAKAINKAGIPKKEKVEELRLFLPPDRILPGNRGTGRGRHWLTALCIVFGPTLLVLALGAVFPETAGR